MYIENIEQLETIVENAIKSEARGLYLEFSVSYSSIIPESIGNISSLRGLYLKGNPSYVTKISGTVK